MVNTAFCSFNELALEIPMIIFIVLFVGGMIAWRVVKHIRKKQGKSNGSSCGCGCSGCAARGSCPSAKGGSYYADETDDAMPEVSVQSTVTCDFSDLISGDNDKNKKA